MLVWESSVEGVLIFDTGRVGITVVVFLGDIKTTDVAPAEEKNDKEQKNERCSHANANACLRAGAESAGG